MNELEQTRRTLDAQVSELEILHDEATAHLAALDERLKRAELAADYNKTEAEVLARNESLSAAEKATKADSLAGQRFQIQTSINTYKTQIEEAKKAAAEAERKLREAEDNRARALDDLERAEFVTDYVRRGGSRAEAMDLWPDVKARRLLERVQAERDAQALRTQAFYKHLF